MKQFFAFGLSIFMFMGILSCSAQDNKQAKAATSVADKVEVYYFHYTRRCMTCNKVEEVSKKAVETLYPAQVKNGSYTFASINLDDASSKQIAERVKASGQSLLTVKGGKQVDLTDKAFMYATTTPDKLQAEIKKAIDGL